jgi:hypothetical protein
MATRKELRDALWNEPFRPFRLHLKDGRTFDILRRDMHMVGEEEFHVGITKYPKEPEPLADYWIPVEFGEIVRVELLDPSGASAAK